MSNWISRKTIDYKNLEFIFKESAKTNQFSNNGPTVQLLEMFLRKVLNIHDDKAVICVNNGSVAIQVLYTAFESKNICTQSFTFPSSAQCSENVQIVDIDQSGGPNLELVNNNIDTLVITNLFGNVVDINKYTTWGNKNNVNIIFDNANCPYTFYKGNNSLNYGNAATFSFHHTKTFGFGEGGCIIVDRKYEKKIISLINFGNDLTVDKFVWLKEGINGKMSCVSAGHILDQLRHFNRDVNHHKLILDTFKSILPKEFTLLPTFSDNPFLGTVAILFPEKVHLEDIKHWPLISKKYYHPLKMTPVATDWWERIVCFPCHVDISVEQVENLRNYFLNIHY
jgi:dTDP-4-amino-4,6-dideoxygalactose transaminase